MKTEHLPSSFLSRRDALRCCVAGSAGLLLMEPIAIHADQPKPTGKAKSVIQVWLWGGPSHLDTFDPKPGAGYDYCGALDKPIETNVKGIQIGQLFPELAKCADKYSLIRSMTHGNNGHETAAYMVQTGRMSERDVFPGLGAVVSYFKGYKAGYTGLIPPYIVLTEPQGRFSEAGFLGPAYKPFATGGNPASTPFEVEGIIYPGLTEERQKTRRDLLGKLNTLGGVLPGNASIKTVADSQDQAYELILGDSRKLFDLSQEKEELRERYGRNTFGQSCLMARRLVESGVPYVTINYGGWDHHKGIFPILNRMGPQLDNGLSTLLTDLSDRGLLESTIVWCCGEFGRTPKIDWQAPWNGGRNHYGKVFSCLISGGGFKGGQVIGSSTAKGEEPAERPVYPADLLGSVCLQLGIPADAELPHPQGDKTHVVPDASEGVKMGGLLKELV